MNSTLGCTLVPRYITVVLKGKYQKKNVSNNPSMDSFTKIYIDSEKLWPKIRELSLFELTLQNDAKKLNFKGVENQKIIFWLHHIFSHEK